MVIAMLEGIAAGLVGDWQPSSALIFEISKVPDRCTTLTRARPLHANFALFRNAWRTRYV